MQTPILFPCCGIVFIVREEAQTYRGTLSFLCNPSFRCDLNMSSLARPQKLYEPDAPIPFNHCGATFSQITQAEEPRRLTSCTFQLIFRQPRNAQWASSHQWVLPIPKNSSLAISIMGMLSGYSSALVWCASHYHIHCWAFSWFRNWRTKQAGGLGIPLVGGAVPIL